MINKCSNKLSLRGGVKPRRGNLTILQNLAIATLPLVARNDNVTTFIAFVLVIKLMLYASYSRVPKQAAARLYHHNMLPWLFHIV